MSEWINHVKQYQAQHGCSYKDALKGAKSTYNKSIEGGKFNLKKTVNKGAKGVKKAGKVLKKNEKLIKFAVGDEYADTVDKAIKVSNRASKIADELETQTGAGGKFNLKKTVNKGAKAVKKGVRVLEKNKNLVKMVVGDEYADTVDKAIKVSNRASKIADVVETQTGAGVKHLGRKLKHTAGKARQITKQVSRNVDKYGIPLASIVAPELVPELIAVNEGVKRINGSGLGSTLKGKINPYLNGGSYSVPHGGSFAVPIRGGCMTCNKPTNSSLISPHHQAFHPKKPKSYAELITNN